jgi:hypothetical protein
MDNNSRRRGLFLLIGPEPHKRSPPGRQLSGVHGANVSRDLTAAHEPISDIPRYARS